MLKLENQRGSKRLCVAAALSSLALAGLTLSACSPDKAQQAPVKIEAPVQAVMTLPSYNGDFVWDMDNQASRVTFTAMQGKAAIKGRFEKFDAAIKLNPDHPETGRIDAVIDLVSVRTGDSEKDGYLAAKEWFDIETYPLARFTSEQISRDNGGGFLAQGPLVIKGMSAGIILPFTLSIEGDKATADGTFDLDRGDFSIGSGPYADEGLLASVITVNIHIEAARKAPE